MKQVEEWKNRNLHGLHDKYNIDYKAQIYTDVDFLSEESQLLHYIDLRNDKMKNNETFLATKQQINDMEIMRLPKSSWIRRVRKSGN